MLGGYIAIYNMQCQDKLELEAWKSVAGQDKPQLAS